MSRDELVAVVARQAERLAARDRQIAEMAGKLGELMETNEALIEKLARLEHLLSRNSGNSSSPPSRDGDPGKPPVPGKKRHGQSGRPRGKQPGAPGSHLAFIDDPHERCDRFPTGRCGCGADLADALDLGVVDSYQEHDIPQVAVRITQYDQHQVACRCGRTPTAARPEGARPGPVGYARTWPRSRCT